MKLSRQHNPLFPIALYSRSLIIPTEKTELLVRSIRKEKKTNSIQYKDGIIHSWLEKTLFSFSTFPFIAGKIKNITIYPVHILSVSSYNNRFDLISIVSPNDVLCESNYDTIIKKGYDYAIKKIQKLDLLKIKNLEKIRLIQVEIDDSYSDLISKRRITFKHPSSPSLIAELDHNKEFTDRLNVVDAVTIEYQGFIVTIYSNGSLIIKNPSIPEKELLGLLKLVYKTLYLI